MYDLTIFDLQCIGARALHEKGQRETSRLCKYGNIEINVRPLTGLHRTQALRKHSDQGTFAEQNDTVPTRGSSYSTATD